MSPAEVRFWLAVKGKQLDGIKFRRQHGIDRYIVDFYAAGPKIAVEIDGDYHLTPKARLYDQERDAFIKSCGIKVIRFTNDEVIFYLPDVLNRLRSFIVPPLLAPKINAKEGPGEVATYAL